MVAPHALDYLPNILLDKFSDIAVTEDVTAPQPQRPFALAGCCYLGVYPVERTTPATRRGAPAAERGSVDAALDVAAGRQC
jgi:hypothetical protein